MDNISIIIPAHNNLRHLKNAYKSLKEHTPGAEIIILDDASTDGTYEWILNIRAQDSKVKTHRSDKRVGHTVLYDVGIWIASTPVVGIMHADMIVGPNYVENIMKHLKPGRVVCGTRIEPPLHPPGNEKIIQDFGMDFDSLNIAGFEKFCLEQQVVTKDQTTRGMFAPWALYKADFLAVGGHDWGFAPFPYEDSDIFQRWILAGYELVQSRDAFVYHLTCRGHRWTGEIGKNDDYFVQAERKARQYYIQKWGSWISNDNECHPVLKPVYRKCSIVDNYVSTELDAWLGDINPASTDGYDVVLTLDLSKVDDAAYSALFYMNTLVAEANEPGVFETGNIKVTINNVVDKSKDLIVADNSNKKIIIDDEPGL